MFSNKSLRQFVAAVVKRSGIALPTVEAVLPHIFDEIRYQLAEGKRCVRIESFGTFAVVDIPERQRRYTYGGRNEIRTYPPMKRLKFAPAANLNNEICAERFDPSRQSFTRFPGDPPLRYRSSMGYNHRKEVYGRPLPKNKNIEQKPDD